MARFRTIENGFWTDSKVVNDFTPDDRYIFLYLLTNPQTNQLGCYELPISKIAFDTGFGKTKITKIIKRLEEELKVIVYDEETNEVFIKNWYKFNWLNSDKTFICIKREFDLIKSEKLKEHISPLYKNYMPHGRKNKKKNKNKNINKNKEREKKKENSSSSSPFLPTLADIISYSCDLKINDESYCEKFYNHYEAIGWVNGSGQAIKNWKLVFHNWAKADGLLDKKEDDEVYLD